MHQVQMKIQSVFSRLFGALAAYWNKFLKSQADNPKEERILTWAVAIALTGLLIFALGVWVVTHPNPQVLNGDSVPPPPVNAGP
jgi:hypothetical protein